MKADLLVRIDDRLLHGQVLLGWASHFEPRRILLAHDGVASDATRCDLYRSMAEGDTAIDVQPLAVVAAELQRTEPRPRTLLVLGSAADAQRLLELGAPLRQVQVGGLHQGPGKKRLLDYVYLSAEDVRALGWLLDRGVALEAQDLPSHRGVPIDRAMLAQLRP